MGHRAPEPTSARRWVARRVGPLVVGWVLATTAASGPTPTRAVEATLMQSREQLRRFPFQPDCGGNTQEMVACLWQRRNQADAILAGLLGKPDLLEQWRSSRRQVCRRAAEKAIGGSIVPIVWLSCENGLNKELLRRIQQPLLQSADL